MMLGSKLKRFVIGPWVDSFTWLKMGNFDAPGTIGGPRGSEGTPEAVRVNINKPERDMDQKGMMRNGLVL